ncbi:MAG: LamG-like jellyroll fold domain-containing protein [Planctomycetota bacterium]
MKPLFHCTLGIPSFFTKLIAIASLCTCFVTTLLGQESKNVKKEIPRDATSKIENERAFDGLCKDSLKFHCDFGGNGDAIRSVGDGRIFTNESLQRKEWIPGIHRKDVSMVEQGGVNRAYLHFSDKSPQVLSFRGEAMHPMGENWSATVSFWMRLDPDSDLKPGYCDPIQITEKGWNDGALFVDFDKDLPRDFRLGVFSDLKFWNPENTPWEKWPVERRPMVTVKQPNFTRQAWTHVAFAISRVNAPGQTKAKATLFLHGKSAGTIDSPMQFSWDNSKTAIMIGIEYIGDFDELMIFDRALTEREVQTITRHLR